MMVRSEAINCCVRINGGDFLVSIFLSYDYVLLVF